MEFGEWNFMHGGKKDLIALAREYGINKNNIYVKGKAEGVNLFLHIRN